MTDEPSTLRHVVRELPRRRVAFVLFVVLGNLGLVSLVRGRRVAQDRLLRVSFTAGEDLYHDYIRVRHAMPVPPWAWTYDEWWETVVLWK